MKAKFTVVWSPSKVPKLAQLRHDNPAIRNDITSAVDIIDAALKHAPLSVGIPAPGSKQEARIVVHPPISLLYRVNVADRKVEVIEVKLWDD